jgi:hypothetical protein
MLIGRALFACAHMTIACGAGGSQRSSAAKVIRGNSRQKEDLPIRRFWQSWQFCQFFVSLAVCYCISLMAIRFSPHFGKCGFLGAIWRGKMPCMTALFPTLAL